TPKGTNPSSRRRKSPSSPSRSCSETESSSCSSSSCCPNATYQSTSSSSLIFSGSGRQPSRLQRRNPRRVESCSLAFGRYQQFSPFEIDSPHSMHLLSNAASNQREPQ